MVLVELGLELWLSWQHKAPIDLLFGKKNFKILS